ncbi:MAG TPA: hypothetical protein VK616_01155 [Flavitalea sp.]|nr:hypothetical protein [Flavitalea sp.]
MDFYFRESLTYSIVAFLNLHLCADEASFITGCDYPIDGGILTLSV